MSEEAVIKLSDLRPAPRAQEAFVLSERERHEIEHEMGHYPDPKAASIEALKIIQKHRGWVPDGAIAPVAALIGMGAAELDGVATFYSLVFRQSVGRNVIKVCDSVSCFLTGYDEIRASLEKQLGIRYGQTTKDNRYTLLPICCLGACDRGPTLMINDDLHGNVTPQTLEHILEQYK